MENRPDESLRYEEGVERLEGMVAQLEQGDLPLETSFRLYEESVGLLKRLSAMLDAGEARVEELTNEGIIPFEEDAP